MEHEDLVGAKLEEERCALLSSPAGGWRSRPSAHGALRRFFGSRTVRQAAGYAGANLSANAIAVVSTAMITRSLRTTEFGKYSFAASFLLFVALFFEFGFFIAAARLAAIETVDKSRDVVGSALLMYIPVGLAFAATIYGLSFGIDDWFHVEAGHVLRIAAPATIAFPFVYVLQQLAQGVDRLHVASAAAVIAQLLFVALLAAQFEIRGGLTAPGALVLRSSAFLIAAFVGALWLRPSFNAVERWARELARQARDWGFQQFIGRVLSIGTYNMDVLMLAFWSTSRSVGLYVLAGSLAMASGLPVSGTAAALFGRMARAPGIAGRWLGIAVVVGAICTLAAVVLAEPAIRLLFSARYVAAAALVLPLALAQLVRGVTGIFNTFLSAHGRGRDLRNAALVLTVSNVVFNFILIPPYGARGAAWASLFALLLNLVAHVLVYRRSYRLRVPRA